MEISAQEVPIGILTTDQLMFYPALHQFPSQFIWNNLERVIKGSGLEECAYKRAVRQFE